VYRATRGGEAFAIKSLRRARGSASLRHPSQAANGSQHRRPLLGPGVLAQPAGTTQAMDVEREMLVMKKLDHPSVVRLFELIDDHKASQVWRTHATRRPHGHVACWNVGHCPSFY